MINKLDKFWIPITSDICPSSQERLGWLGRIVEPYFATGSCCFRITSTEMKKAVLLEKTYKSHWYETVNKVDRVILHLFRFISYLTGVVPLAMLFGKIIYRNMNHFEVRVPWVSDRPPPLPPPPPQPKLDIREIRVLVSEMIQELCREEGAPLPTRNENNMTLSASLIDREIEGLELETMNELTILARLKRRLDEQYITYRCLKKLTTKKPCSKLLELKRKIDLLNQKLEEKVRAKKQRLKTMIESLHEITWRSNLEESGEEIETINFILKKYNVILQLNLVPLRSRTMTSNSLGANAPIPLPNIGNSCYLNSALQLLLNSPFHSWLSSKVDSDAQILQALKALDEILHTIDERDIIESALETFMGAYFAADPGTYFQSRYAQMDARDVVSLLLGEIGFQFECSFHEEIEGEMKIRKDPHLECLRLSVHDLADSDEPIVLQERLENIWLHDSPMILPIQINRLSGLTRSDATKISNPLELPENLIIHVKDDDSFITDRKVKYQLIGLINHNGDGKRGHYIAYVKKKNKWYLCNDSFVRCVPKVRVRFKDGYILLFEKV